MANYKLIYKLIADDKAFKSGFDKASTAVRNHTAQMKRNGAQSRDLGRHLTLLQNKSRAAAVAHTTNSTQYKVAAKKAKTYRLELDRLNRSLAKSGVTGSGGKNKMGSIAGVAMNRVLPLVAIGAVSQGVRAVTSDLIQYEKTMSSVQAVTGASPATMKEFDKAAKLISSTLPKTATEVAQLTVELSRLGFEADQVLFAIEPITRLSVAAMSDLSSTAIIVAQSLNSFGLEASRSAEIADTFAYAISNSALDLEKIQTGLPNVATAAKQFGWTLQKTTGLLGILADAGIDASKMGTDLRMVITQLSKRGLTLDQALGMIAESTNKVNKAQELFGQRSFVSALALADQKDEASALDEEYKNIAGSAAKMARIMQDNVAGSLDMVSSAWGTLTKTIFQSNGVAQGFFEHIARQITNLTVQLGGLDAGTLGIEKDFFGSETKGAAIRLSGGIWKEGEKNANVLAHQLVLLQDQLKTYEAIHKENEIAANTNQFGFARGENGKLNTKDWVNKEKEITSRHQVEALKQLIREINAKLTETPLVLPVTLGNEEGEGDSKGKSKTGFINEMNKAISIYKDRLNSIDASSPFDAEARADVEKYKALIESGEKAIDDFLNGIEERAPIKLDWLDKEFFVDEIKELNDTDFLRDHMFKNGASIAEAFFEGLNSSTDFLLDQTANTLVLGFESLFTGKKDPFEGYFSMILGNFGDFLIQWGSGIVAAGVGAIALSALSPTAMLIAGGSMIVLGAAMKGAANSMVSSGTLSSGGSLPSGSNIDTPSGYSQYSSGYGGSASSGAFSGSGGMQVEGEFKIKGADLIAVIDKTERRNKNFR